jgi:hypothetical protein
VFLLLGVPAILPPAFADSISYHLAYAVDWANAGRIYVDPFLRFPYYANNFLLFYSALFIMKLDRYCHFLTWLCGLLTCLGIQAFFRPAESRLEEGLDRKELFTEQFLIPLCVALSPVFLRYLNVAYIDIPIGLFVLTTVLCAYRSSAHQPFERQLVLTGAFCAGMKLILIGHVPFFLVLLYVTTRRWLRRRKIAILSLALVALSLPWYVRNFIQTHDPTPPIFNRLFNHPDPIFSQDDGAIYTAGTLTEQRPAHLVLLPFKFFADPESRNFGEWGVSAMILLLYAPILFLIGQLCLRHRWHPPNRLVCLSGAVAYLALPWWFFSSIGRYSLHWYPVFAAWVGAVISYTHISAAASLNSRFAKWVARVAAAAVSCILIFPSPTEDCRRFYKLYYSGVIQLLRLGGNMQAYLKNNVDGYVASKALIKALASSQRENSRVLAFELAPLAFYFRKAKIISVGDHFGPARYGGLFRAVSNGDCSSYLRRLDVLAVIVQPRRSGDWWPPFYQKLRSHLRACNFTEYRCLEDNIAIFLRDDINPAPGLFPVVGR